MTPKTPDGPALEQYLETRLNILTDALKVQGEANSVAILALKLATEAAALASDLRYQQRFTAQSDALSAAFAAAKEAVAAARDAQDRAVLKAEVAADKRFESVNEFRKTLTDQQQTFMPRAQVDEIARGLTDKFTTMKEQVDGLLSERMGIKGGWGYAVGVVGFLLLLAAFALRFVGR
jgi:hypothetical protein